MTLNHNIVKFLCTNFESNDIFKIIIIIYFLHSFTEIKCAPYLHHYFAFNMVLIYALVLMLHTKFVPRSGINFLNYDAELVQIRCHKGATIKMHKCLVGYLLGTPVLYFQRTFCTTSLLYLLILFL